MGVITNADALGESAAVSLDRNWFALGTASFVASAFFLACLWNMGVPSVRVADEAYYVRAAEMLASGTRYVNYQHPPFAKDIMAAALLLFGQSPVGWRLPSVFLGAVGLFACMRSYWWASRSTVGSVTFGILLASSFLLFGLARIALLEVYVFAFCALAVWTAFLYFENGRRLHLVLCGLFMGLGFASKWSAFPVLAAIGIVFALYRRRALAWLAPIALATYFATFAPAFFMAENPLSFADLLAMQWLIFVFHRTPLPIHPQQSEWWQWALNTRPFWLLAEPTDGAFRATLLAGNPASTWLTLPALAWCAMKRSRLGLGLCLGFVLCLLFWAISGKNSQFYYSYLPASVFALGALAYALQDLWEREWRAPAVIVCAASCVCMAAYWPILTAAPLKDRNSLRPYTLLQGWAPPIARTRQSPSSPSLPLPNS